MKRRGPGAVTVIATVCAFFAVLLTSGRDSFRYAVVEGPGVTLDESFNVEMGVYLLRNLRTYGLASLHMDTVRDVWGGPEYNPDHPPLGRLALGIAHDVGSDPQSATLSNAAARPASAVAFAITVLLVTWCTARWYGNIAGTTAGLALILMPRQFAHAHLASLETFIALACTACILWVANRWPAAAASPAVESSLPPSRHRYRFPASTIPVVAAGLLFGLALLTKIQAVFLAPAVILWAFWKLRLAAIPRLAVFGGVGFVVFFAGWPWLWLDPVEHLREYFARTTERQTLYCFYAGQRWADRDVPWHYPWVMTAVTIPLGFQLLAIAGLVNPYRKRGTDEAPIRGFQDSRLQLVMLAIIVPLLVFSLPGIRVYDGERLFGTIFPLCAVVIGRGAAALWHWCKHRMPPLIRRPLGIGFLALQSIGVIAYHPCQLSYYNLEVGGLRGADRLGFERTYWADSLTETFQRRIIEVVPKGTRIDVAPVLHPFYLRTLLDQSPTLSAAGITLEAYDDKQPGGSRYVLMFHRKADPWDSLLPPPPGTETLAELTRDGVPLVSLYKLP